MYKENDIVKCTITGFKDYGIFVSVDENYNGLIHISEISESFVKNVTDYGEIGDIIYAKVIEIDEKIKHLKLSIKNINYKIDGKSIDNTFTSNGNEKIYNYENETEQQEKVINKENKARTLKQDEERRAGFIHASILFYAILNIGIIIAVTLIIL